MHLTSLRAKWRISRLILAFLLAPASSLANSIEIHGSNTVGATLAPMLVRGFLEQLTGNGVSERPADRENEKYLTASHKGERIQVLVAAHGSSTGFKALKAGSADIWASSRPAKPAEIEQMAGKADLRGLASEHVIAIDGLAILVHPSNPVNQLSTDNLAQIFSGQISNWSELGGPNRKITLYARDDHSGTWDTFKSLVLGKQYTLSPKAKRYESNDQLSDDVSKDPSGIGFAGLASVRGAKLLAVSDANAPALKPGQLTVASEDYALARRLFMYTRGDQGGQLVNDFIEFTQSAEGQAIVAKSGFISQNPIAVEPSYDDSIPKSFKLLTQNYRRLTVNFRFAEGRTKLDNKAQRDLKRVREYLKQENRDTSDLLLIGFADQQSNELRAQMISELRALSVSKALKQERTDTIAYTGYGQYMPVGSSGGNTGAKRNGRVEIWIKR